MGVTEKLYAPGLNRFFAALVPFLCGLSGVVLAKNAPNKANAMKLIEWLVVDTAQQMYANSVFEYPMKAGIAINPQVAAFGTLKPDALPVVKVGQNKKAAANLVDKVGFDN